jgi:hypothetical protein
MKASIRSCVKCGVALRRQEIRAAGPFPCPSCHTQLQAVDSYAHWITVSNLVLATGAFFMFGFRGLHLVFAVLLSWFPLQFLMSTLVPRLLPPRIEIADPRTPFEKLKDPVELRINRDKHS